MRYNAILNIATEGSKDLFTLPSKHMALLLNIFAILLPYYWFYVLKLRSAALEYVSFALTFLVISFAMIWRSAPYLDTRRSLWAGFFIILPLAIGSLLEVARIPFYFMVYTSVLLASLISWSLGEGVRAKALPIALSLVSPLMCKFQVITFVFSIIAISSAYLVGQVIGKISEPVLGFRNFDSVRALAEIVLSGSGRKLEQSLEKRGVKGLVTYDLIKLGDLALVTADIHPGPFKMGSYDAPSRIISSLENRGVKSVFLRRACSHERNLASSGYLDMLIDSMLNDLERTSPCCISAPIFIKTKSFELSAQKFGDTILFTVSGHLLRSFEDIPHEIEEIVSRELGASISIVDRHDSLMPDHYEMAFPDTELGRELLDGLISLSSRIPTRCYKKVEAGYAEGHPSWNSIGSGGIRVLSLKTQDWIISYLSIDGNNMVPELRDELDRMTPKGVSLVVATTDTHEVISTKVAYNPVGKECENDYNCLREEALYLMELVRKSLNSMIPVEASCYRGRREVTFIGRDLMAMLSPLMRVGSMAKYLITLALMPQILILLWTFL